MRLSQRTARIRTTGRLVSRYTVGLLGLRRNDIWLASFPRVGSTWVRFVLCNLISLSELDGREVDFHFLDATMPALGESNLLATWQIRTVPRFVKTHQSYHLLLFAIPRRAVYIIRDPRDVMVSYYHFLQTHALETFSRSFTQFIRHPRYGLRACIKHYLSWEPHVTVLIRYEALREDPQAEFRKMFSSLQIPVHNDLLWSSVERSSFEKVRSFETTSGLSRQHNTKAEFRFARRGEPKQWVEYFSEKDASYYHQVCRDCGFDLYP